CLARSALARDAEYDQIPDDDFGTATRGEEIVFDTISSCSWSLSHALPI
ncbi:hypothetical protein Tco_1190644, partial [Tanacetum coccineum]